MRWRPLRVTTYGGNPLGCAVARAVLDTVDDPALLASVRHKQQQSAPVSHDHNQQ